MPARCVAGHQRAGPRAAVGGVGGPVLPLAVGERGAVPDLQADAGEGEVAQPDGAAGASGGGGFTAGDAVAPGEGAVALRPAGRRPRVPRRRAARGRCCGRSATNCGRRGRRGRRRSAGVRRRRDASGGGGAVRRRNGRGRSGRPTSRPNRRDSSRLGKQKKPGFYGLKPGRHDDNRYRRWMPPMRGE